MNGLRQNTWRIRLSWLGGSLAAVLALSWGSALAPIADGQVPLDVQARAATNVELTPSVTAIDEDPTQALEDVAPMQNSCGDGRCDPPDDCHSCPADCGSCCGNHRCESPEDCRSCPTDCGGCCGDGRCDAPEDRNSCPRDC